MADLHKLLMHRKCGVGGIYCYCCNRYLGRYRKKLSRLSRHILNQEDRKEQQYAAK